MLFDNQKMGYDGQGVQPVSKKMIDPFASWSGPALADYVVSNVLTGSRDRRFTQPECCHKTGQRRCQDQQKGEPVI